MLERDLRADGGFGNTMGWCGVQVAFMPLPLMIMQTGLEADIYYYQVNKLTALCSGTVD